MKNLLEQLKRVWKHTNSIMHKLISRTTKGTSVAFKTIGSALGTILASATMLGIFIAVLLVSIPTGIFFGKDIAQKIQPNITNAKVI